MRSTRRSARAKSSSAPSGRWANFVIRVPPQNFHDAQLPYAPNPPGPAQAERHEFIDIVLVDFSKAVLRLLLNP